MSRSLRWREIRAHRTHRAVRAVGGNLDGHVRAGTTILFATLEVARNKMIGHCTAFTVDGSGVPRP